MNQPVLFAKIVPLLALVAVLGACNQNKLQYIGQVPSPDGKYVAEFWVEVSISPLSSDIYHVTLYKQPRADRFLFSSPRKEVLDVPHARNLTMHWDGDRDLVLGCHGCDIKDEYVRTAVHEWNGITISHLGFLEGKGTG